MRKVLYLLLLLLVTGSGSVFAEKGQNNYVGPESALKFAEKFITKELKVVPENLEIKYEVYDIDESVLGYYIGYTDGGEKNNIIISASKDRTPIIQYGEGDIEVSNINERLYYLGALNYWFAPNKDSLESQFDEVKNTKIKNLKSNLSKDKKKLSKVEQMEVEETIDRLMNEKIKSFPKGNYEKEWKTLESVPENNEFTLSATASYSKMLGVGRVWQRMSGVTNPNSSCGPASGVMVANYLKTKGYNVRDSAYYGQTYKFINHLWSEMSFYWGASMSSYRNEMENHLNLNYATHKFDVVSWNLSSSGFWLYEDWINEGFPVTIRFNNLSQGKYWSDWHFVVGAAYNVTSSGEFIGVKDPDNGSTNVGFNYFPFVPNQETISFAKIDYYNY